MNHVVLARKWRPKKFTDLVGQEHSVTILKNIIHSKRLHHAYLLTGTRGVGKTTIARIIAKALNCLHLTDNEPCGTCSNCTQIDLGRFVDVIEIDAASNTGVDNVRELIDDAKYAPSSGQYKIYIVDEVHMLSKSAFNAMLKTLEEPPEHVIFILATTDLQKVPITILSRCLQLKLRNLLATEIMSHLTHVLQKEDISFEPKALESLAVAANGSMRDGLSLLDQAIAFSNQSVTTSSVKTMLGITDDEVIFAILDALSQSDGQKLTTIATSIHKQGTSLENVLDSLQQQLCNISVMQLTATNINPMLTKYAKTISVNDTHLYFEIANLGLEQLSRQNNKYPVFVMTLLRMLAFHIGSNSQKQITMQSSNFIPATSFTDEPSKDVHTPSTDWFSVITTLKLELGYIYPILENAELINHTDNKFVILVDERYKNILNSDTISKLTSIFDDYFKVKTRIDITFTDRINNSLKEKIQKEKEQKQKFAEDAIYSDPNLTKIVAQFSATILPNSIKPL